MDNKYTQGKEERITDCIDQIIAGLQSVREDVVARRLEGHAHAIAEVKAAVDAAGAAIADLAASGEE